MINLSKELLEKFQQKKCIGKSVNFFSVEDVNNNFYNLYYHSTITGTSLLSSEQALRSGTHPLNLKLGFPY